MKIGQQVHFHAMITRIIDSSSYPDWLELRFKDANGQEWIVEEKAPVVTLEEVTPGESYKEDASIAGVVIDMKISDDGRSIVVVNTEAPWGVESIDGNSRFEMFAENIILDP